MKKMMRWMLLGAMFVSGAALANAQTTKLGNAKDDLFAGTGQFAKNAKSATEINMGPNSLEMVGGNDSDHAHRMVLNVVRTYTYDKPGMYDMAAVDVYRKKLQTSEWHCSVHTWDMKTGDSTDVCEKDRTDGLRESAIVTVSAKSLTFIHTIHRAKSGGQSELEMLPGAFSTGDMSSLAILHAELRRMKLPSIQVMPPAPPEAPVPPTAPAAPMPPASPAPPSPPAAPLPPAAPAPAPAPVLVPVPQSQVL